MNQKRHFLEDEIMAMTRQHILYCGLNCSQTCSLGVCHQCTEKTLGLFTVFTTHLIANSYYFKALSMEKEGFRNKTYWYVFFCLSWDWKSILEMRLQVYRISALNRRPWPSSASQNQKADTGSEACLCDHATVTKEDSVRCRLDRCTSWWWICSSAL